MTPAAASASVYGANAYHAAHRLSGKGIAAIIAAHVGVLALLASLDVVPMPAPLATLMVEVLPPAPPPAPEITPPRPKPVERQPTPRPQPKPVPQVQPQTLAAQTQAPSAASEVPVVKEAVSVPQPPAPAPAPTAPTVSQPRFDADYLSNPAPTYPPLSRRLGEEGKVMLRVYVQPDGRPSQIEIKTSSGSSRLDQAAQEAVWRWKFIPARRGDEAVGGWVQVPINFNLKG